MQSQMQSWGLALPPELEVGPSAARVSKKRKLCRSFSAEPRHG